MDQSSGPRTAQEHAPPVTTVLVHGVWTRGVSMARLKRRLEARGMRVETFEYPSVTRSLAENATALASFLERAPGGTLHLVGHSLGGAVIRTMLETGIPARLGRIVCLGAPLRGTRTGAYAARLPGGRFLIGKSVADLVARGGFDDWAGAPEVGSVAGRIPFGVGWLFGPFGEPNDGTVAVAETMLRGQRDHIVLKVSHMALVWSVRVASQVEAFLTRGEFVRGVTRAA